MTDFATPLDSYAALAVATVTNSAAKIVSAVTPARIVTVQSDPGNTVTIYLGDTSSVATTPTLAHTALAPGDFRVFELKDASLVYAIAASSSKLLIGVGK